VTRVKNIDISIRVNIWNDSNTIFLQYRNTYFSSTFSISFLSEGEFKVWHTPAYSYKPYILL